MDVFKIKGVGISRLSQKLTELIPAEKRKGILKNPDALDDVLINIWNALTESGKKGLHVRITQGQSPHDDSDSEQEAPGLVLYVPEILIEYEDLSEHACIDEVRDFLKKILENTSSPLPDLMKERIPEALSIPIQEVEAEGAFY